MKISAREGYGLRILLTLARNEGADGLTIAQISEQEELSSHNVAKILRVLRLQEFVISSRGQAGGYRLARPADEILLVDVLETLGGRLFEEEPESDHGDSRFCTGSVDCSLRSLWKALQMSIDRVTEGLSLQDLMGGGRDLQAHIYDRLNMKEKMTE